jgi:hypothetical protein
VAVQVTDHLHRLDTDTIYADTSYITDVTEERSHTQKIRKAVEKEMGTRFQNIPKESFISSVLCENELYQNNLQ